MRIIVGFTPGSATDITARLFAQRFSEMRGVGVTVENIPGSGRDGWGREGREGPAGRLHVNYGQTEQ